MLQSMDTPFPYNRYVTGRDFTGRRNERTILQNLIAQGEHVALYEPDNTGKMSLVQQVLLDMRLSGKQFAVARVQMMQVRSVAAFLKAFAEAAIRAVASSPSEYQQIVQTCLEGTHFVFDKEVPHHTYFKTSSFSVVHELSEPLYYNAEKKFGTDAPLAAKSHNPLFK